jgi:hypothetical protein
MALTGELAPVIAEQQFRHPTLTLRSIQGSHHIFSLQGLPHLDSHSLTCEDIQYRQCNEASPVLQLIGDEIDAPRLVWPRCLEPLFAVFDRFPFPLWTHLLQRKPFFLI